MMHLVNVERRVVKLELSTVEDDDVVARMHAVIQQVHADLRDGTVHATPRFDPDLKALRGSPAHRLNQAMRDLEERKCYIPINSNQMLRSDQFNLLQEGKVTLITNEETK
jgi:hypothetical protein